LRKHLHELSERFGRGTLVQIRNPHDFTGAMRRFKRKVQDARIFQDLKDREYPMTTGQTKRRDKNRAIMRLKMQKKSELELEI